MPWRTSSAEALLRRRWMITALLGIWLTGWIVSSWPAMQDDALIHLRYAENLHLHHFITYDGVHPNYGASSLLYVGILALLCGITTSAELPRAVSSVVHLVLFCGIAVGAGVVLPKQARVARMAALVLLVLVVAPGSVRWLDDGMETGLAVSLATLLAWMIHSSVAPGPTLESMVQQSPTQRFGILMVAFFAVLLRTELLLLCAVGCLILFLERRRKARRSGGKGNSLESGFAVAPLLIGAGMAVCLILAAMRVLLPDTAVAKAHGIGEWFSPIHDTAVTLAGAFSFGAGMLVFWLLTLLLVAMRRGVSAETLLANCFCPVVVALSAFRGQEIQGVRYLAWTFFFSIAWNILELGEVLPEGWSGADAADRFGTMLLYGFLGLLLVEMPFESLAMHRVMTHRAATERLFESEHLDLLRTHRGVASDIGFIGYFTGADICDLAGLVNGRAAARLTSAQRVEACAATKPDFLYVNKSQLGPMAKAMELAEWQVCGRYGFANIRTEDVHYLLVRPEIAAETCGATGVAPVAVDGL